MQNEISKVDNKEMWNHIRLESLERQEDRA